MTKSMEMSTQSFQRMGQMHQPWQNTKKISEQPVLDLSCKKVTMDKVSSECGVDFSITKFRHSPELQKEKNNNNQVNSYNVNNIQQIQATQMYQQQTSNNFVALNHERNSPENRSFVITPPSETESPLKMGYQPVYSNAGPMPNEVQKQPLYPILPIKVPVHSPVSVPPMLSAIIPQSTSQPIISPVPQTQIPSLAALPESSPTSVSSDDSKRNPRPFKAYPKDPLSLAFGPEMIFDPDMKKSYSDFRSRMLESVRKTNEGTNIKMRRVSKSPTLPAHPSDEKDAAYWERRRKNNEAAKRSRDARRAKEDEIAIRAAFLEQEYIRLKYENALLKDENTKFKCMIYGH